ncbi:YlxR family protein [[Mycoplasma] anseris]|uniref:YlxR family protein n=2 Tax=[Mycoplasma] anseris TaxID=92400 RepID=A0A2Z4NDT2_9BACT|nr:YlxR family protein [[Mycoplasma] anseris]
MKIDKKNYSRKSIVDNQIYPIADLLRFSKDQNGEIHFDPQKTHQGRGAYCLKTIEQIEQLFKKRLLNRAFKQNIEIEVYNKLRNEVDEWVRKIQEEEFPMLKK